MKNDEPVGSKNQAEGTKNLLEDIIREGARKLLQAAIEHEMNAYVDSFKDLFIPRKRGPVAQKADPIIRRNAELERENARLVHKLKQAELIIDVQKKVAELLKVAGLG